MRMEMEKRRSKGSFLNLFDWNGKSRKKLFYENPNLPEDAKQGKENVENMPKSQLNRINVDDNGASPSNIASCDFKCALSIVSDEGSVTKAPGLVARLMGLDSLPASAVTEFASTTLYGSSSFGSSNCHEGAIDSVSDYHPVDYINMPFKQEKSSQHTMESRTQKIQNRPIKRFQTEMLPPKSAKPIPVTHNKLLSPIKSPGYISPKNAAHIMEAAAKIIVASPQQHMKNKMSSVGSSAAPLRILDLKERLEFAQYASMPEKHVNSSTANLVKGKPSDKSNGLYKCNQALKSSRDSERYSSHGLASKRTSGSLTIQAKANVQSRDKLISNGDSGYMKQKEQNEVKSNQSSRSQKAIRQQAMQQRTCTSRNSNVLGRNNLKQNSITNKGKSTSKIDSNKPNTQTRSSESSTGARKLTNEGAVNANIGLKRSSRRATDTQKEFPVSKSKGISRKKRYSSMDLLSEARVPDKAVHNGECKSIKCNITTDGSINQDAFNMKESKDVISFTFTSPLRKTMPELQSSAQVIGRTNGTDVNSLDHSDKLYPKKLSLSPDSPPGLHIIDGDDLSVLLEKKLQELTSKISLPQCNLGNGGSSVSLSSSSNHKVPSVVSAMSRKQDQRFCPNLLNDNLDGTHDYGHSSSDDMVLNMNQQLQKSDTREEPTCSSNSEVGNGLGCQYSGAVTVFEAPFVSESYVDSEDSTYGSTVYSSMQDDEVSNFSPINESAPLEDEVNSSEQSSFTLGGNMTIEQLSGISDLADFKRSRNLELEYINDVLNNAELMAEEFVMGQTDKVIMPNLFDLLENQSNGTESYGEEYTKLERKVLFDCVNEFLELRCREAFIGSCKAWPKWVTSVQSKGWLAEDLYKELLGFKSMDEEMVDELVSKDMSSRHGKWLDFDIEAFEEGLQVEWHISTSLINELVSDLLLV